MTVTLNPYVHLRGEARAALEQYAAIFGGTPQIMTYADMGAEGEHAELVMHGYLGTPDGLQLMVSDQTPDDPVDIGDGPHRPQQRRGGRGSPAGVVHRPVRGRRGARAP